MTLQERILVLTFPLPLGHFVDILIKSAKLACTRDQANKILLALQKHHWNPNHFKIWSRKNKHHPWITIYFLFIYFHTTSFRADNFLPLFWPYQTHVCFSRIIQCKIKATLLHKCSKNGALKKQKTKKNIFNQIPWEYSQWFLSAV